MSQSRRGSVVEALASTFVGFWVSFAAWRLIGPLLGYHVSVSDNFIITGLFTVISVVRGYLVRRFFNGAYWTRLIGVRNAAAQ